MDDVVRMLFAGPSVAAPAATRVLNRAGFAVTTLHAPDERIDRTHLEVLDVKTDQELDLQWWRRSVIAVAEALMAVFAYELLGLEGSTEVPAAGDSPSRRTS